MTTADVQPVTLGRRARRHSGTAWPTARLLASQVAPLPAAHVPLSEALGRMLSGDLIALNPLPATDNSAMDGWAVSGSPPWQVVGDLPAGRLHPRPLRAGECLRIATGAAVPEGAAAVLPFEDSVLEANGVRPASAWSEGAPPRSHIRRRAGEARRGDVLLPTGAVVTPPVLGLAAAAGNDTLLVVPTATVDVLVLGDELLDTGLASAGCTRDALGPQLPGWLAGFGASTRSVRRLADDLATLTDALARSSADVLVTTGGTSVGPRDQVHRTLQQVGGRLVVDAVDVKPGHPMLLASLPGGRWLVGLPGNPLAACAAMLTLVEPLLAALAGRRPPPPATLLLAGDQPERPGDGHRLLPVAQRSGGVAEVLPSCGSAMLRGLALASGLAVIGPEGAAAGDPVTYLPLPW